MWIQHSTLIKMTAHAGDATTLDWHPRQRGIIATGGAGDRCVKIWNLLDKLNLEKDDSYMAVNSNTVTSRADSIATDSSTENDSRYE